MAEFPRLKTGAIAQFPTETRTSYRTSVFRFVDGQEQRISHQGERRSWELKLSNLDDHEWASLRAFFDERRGRFGGFTFTDPRSGTTHEGCYFEDDELACRVVAEGRTECTIRIQGGAW
jgi:hypothetical protein